MRHDHDPENMTSDQIQVDEVPTVCVLLLLPTIVVVAIERSEYTNGLLVLSHSTCDA